jgi:hypothetical protein
MTDFVTRLEAELHSAAVQRERSGRMRGVALPRLRMVLRDIPAAALATVLFALAIAGAAIMLSASPERRVDTGVPTTLRGVWQAPPKELRLYPRGSERCVKVGVGSSSACYTLGDSATGVAREWGRLSVAGDELTLTGTQDATPGVYRWRIQRGTLRLTKLHDPVSKRARALVTTPLQLVHPARARAKLPSGWASHPFTSRRFGYSLQLPADWLIDTSGPTDRFALDPSRGTLPAVSVVARDLPPGTTPGWWTVTFDSRFGRFESAGCAFHAFHQFFLAGTSVRVSVYADCDGEANRQAASFIHDGRGYGVIWHGASAPPDRDYPLFDALLKSFDFPG